MSNHTCLGCRNVASNQPGFALVVCCKCSLIQPANVTPSTPCTVATSSHGYRTRESTCGAVARLKRNMARRNVGAVCLRGLGWTWPGQLRDAVNGAAFGGAHA